MAQLCCGHRGRIRTVALAAAALALFAASAACGRSNSPAQGPTTPSTRSSTPNASASAVGSPGVFGDLGRICGPAKPGQSPASTGDQRGITDTTIRIGTIADPGAVAAPGLEQEYFDVGDAFVKWCNAAGGINGRKIVLDKYDAKLFEGAAQVINACQKDFMLVGNGNAFDEADVKPRLACKLGQIPALDVSPAAGLAGLQVQPTSNNPSHYGVGPLRQLVAAYPEAKQGIGIGSSNVASLQPQGVKAKEAYESLGYKVTVVQEKPPLVDNFRPYMEQLKQSGAKAYQEIASQDPAPEVNAMHNVGWQPAFILWSIQFYDPKSVQAAKTMNFPPSYVGLGALSADLADQFPVLQQMGSILSTYVPKSKYTSFTGLAFSAWTLWAKSASECGAQLTQDCVLQKAGAYTDWTAGGFFPPHSTQPGKQQISDCFILVRLTPDGFKYDREVTKPNRGVYNCGPQNLVKVH